MIAAITISGESITVQPNERHEWTLTSKDVAKGYGVSKDVVKKHKTRNAAELVEGKHWIKGGTNCTHPSSESEAIVWTKRGVIRLGFFIKSERAKQFRDAAEDLILQQHEQQQTEPQIAAIERLAAQVALLQQHVTTQQQAFAACAPIENIFGTISHANGLPRLKMVRAYYKGGKLNSLAVQFLKTQDKQLHLPLDGGTQ